MRLTRLRIRDIGRHVLLDKEIDVPVVGLVGPNGTGKTTILETIDFAFNGYLKEKQESYVRNAFRPDPPEGEKDPNKPSNGDVTVWFRKDGKIGEIYRRVGKSPKRYFIWEGETYKAAADIEAKLKELFEADKDAMSNAVFPPQGSLDKLLFGTQAERADLFTKLLLISYTNKIVDQADRNIAILLEQVQDYTTLMTEIKTQHAMAEDALAKLEGEKARSYDWSADYQYFRDYRVVVEDQRGYEARKRELEQQIESHRLNLEKTVAAMGQVLGIKHAALEDVLEGIDTLDSDIKKLRADVETNTRVEKLKNQKESIDTRLKEIKNKRAVLEDRLANTKDQTENITNTKKHIEAQKERARLLTELSDKILPRQAAIQKDIAAWEERNVDLPTEEELNQLSAECRLHRQTAILAEGRVDALTALVNAGEHDTTTCPVCRQDASGASNDWMLQLQVAKKELVPLKEKADEITMKERLLRDKVKTQEVTKRTLDKLTNEVEHEIAEAQRNIENIKPMDLDQLEDELNAYEADHHRGNTLQESLESLDQEQKTLESIVNGITPSDMLGVINFDPFAADTVKKELEYTQNKRRDVRLGNSDDKVIDLIRSSEASIAQSEMDLAQNEDRRQDNAQQAGRMFANLSSKTLKILEDNGNDQVAALETLKERAQAYVELTGEVKQAEAQANKLQARRDEIEAQIEKDRVRQQVVSELKTLKSAFQRKSIPQTYMQYIFESLTPMAQENLNALGADFVIEPDPEEPVTIRFMKLTEDGSGWMPQNKMSGGQKVRVSVAYLLAVQQLIIPDIAFLVLDEPSTHIDDDGIESMKDLFTSLGEQLQHTEAQIIVCDHKPELQTAFQETIHLK